jgi:hypothetical protein
MSDHSGQQIDIEHYLGVAKFTETTALNKQRSQRKV